MLCAVDRMKGSAFFPEFPVLRAVALPLDMVFVEEGRFGVILPDLGCNASLVADGGVEGAA